MFWNLSAASKGPSSVNGRSSVLHSRLSETMVHPEDMRLIAGRVELPTSRAHRPTHRPGSARTRRKPTGTLPRHVPRHASRTARGYRPHSAPRGRRQAGTNKFLRHSASMSAVIAPAPATTNANASRVHVIGSAAGGGGGYDLFDRLIGAALEEKTPGHSAVLINQQQAPTDPSQGPTIPCTDGVCASDGDGDALPIPPAPRIPGFGGGGIAVCFTKHAFSAGDVLDSGAKQHSHTHSSSSSTNVQGQSSERHSDPYKSIHAEANAAADSATVGLTQPQSHTAGSSHVNPSASTTSTTSTTTSTASTGPSFTPLGAVSHASATMLHRAESLVELACRRLLGTSVQLDMDAPRSPHEPPREYVTAHGRMALRSPHQRFVDAVCGGLNNHTACADLLAHSDPSQSKKGVAVLLRELLVLLSQTAAARDDMLVSSEIGARIRVQRSYDDGVVHELHRQHTSMAAALKTAKQERLHARRAVQSLCQAQERLEGELQGARKEVTVHLQTHTALTQQIASAQQHSKEQEERIDALKQSLSRSQDAVAAQEARIVDMQRQLDDARDTHSQLDQQVRHHRQRGDSLQQSVSVMRGRLSDMNAKIGQTVGSLHSTRLSRAELREQLTAVANRSQETQVRLSRTKRILSAQTGRVQQLELSLDAAKQSVQEVETELEQARKAAAAEAQVLSAQLEAARTQLASLTQQNASMRAWQTEHEQRERKARMDLNDTREKLAQSRAHLQQSQTALNTSQQQCASLQQDLAASQQRGRELEETVVQRDGRVTGLQRELEEAQMLGEGLEAQLDTAQQEITSTKAKLHVCSMSLEQSTRKCERLAGELVSAQSSHRRDTKRADDERAQLAKALKQARAEARTARRAQDKAERKHARTSSHAQSMSARVKQLSGSAKEAAVKGRRLNAALDEVAHLKDEASKQSRELTRVQEKCVELQQRVHSVESAATLAIAERDRVTKLHVTVRDERDRFHKQQVQMRVQLAKARQDSAQLKTKEREQRRAHRVLTGRIMQLEKHKAGSERQMRALQGRVEEMKVTVKAAQHESSGWAVKVRGLEESIERARSTAAMLQTENGNLSEVADEQRRLFEESERESAELREEVTKLREALAKLREAMSDVAKS